MRLALNATDPFVPAMKPAHLMTFFFSHHQFTRPLTIIPSRMVVTELLS